MTLTLHGRLPYFLTMALIATVSHTLADVPVLRWNGAPGGVWDAATVNWLNADDQPVADVAQ